MVARKSRKTKEAREKRVRRTIRRISREIQEIEEFAYQTKSMDLDSQQVLLEMKRDDIVRGFVLQMHTSIEDLLNEWLKCRLLGCSHEELRIVASKRRRASRNIGELLEGYYSVGFAAKLKLMLGLGMLRMPEYKKLVELNEIRNKCSHNWLLNVRVRKKTHPRAPKRPLLHFRGENLHKGEVLQKFAAEYGPLYVRLFKKIYV